MKQIIIIVVIAILLGGGLYYASTKFGSRQRLGEEVNLSISAEFNNKRIKTGYVLEKQEGIVIGQTSQSFELEKARKNEIITLQNVNLEGQEFFKDLREINVSKPNQRITLKLETPKEIRIRVFGDNPKRVNLYSKDAREILFCIKYSTAYIFVEAKNHTEIENPPSYESWDKCYEGGFSLKDEEENIYISYKEFTEPKEKDYINISIMQKEFIGERDRLEIIK